MRRVLSLLPLLLVALVVAIAATHSIAARGTTALSLDEMAAVQGGICYDAVFESSEEETYAYCNWANQTSCVSQPHGTVDAGTWTCVSGTEDSYCSLYVNGGRYLKSYCYWHIQYGCNRGYYTLDTHYEANHGGNCTS